MSLARACGADQRHWVLAAAVLVLASCAPSPQPTVVPEPKPTVSTFNRALHRQYLCLAERGGGDALTSEWFRHKAAASAQGEMVTPIAADPIDIAREQSTELARARQELASAIEEGARLGAPVPLAAAQSRFDCWVEWLRIGAEANDPLAQCRHEFEAAIAAVPKLLPIAFRTAPVGRYPVSFAPGSAELTASAWELLSGVASDVRRSSVRNIRLLAAFDPDDTSGSAAALAASRVEQVVRTLSMLGVDHVTPRYRLSRDPAERDRIEIQLPNRSLANVPP